MSDKPLISVVGPETLERWTYPIVSLAGKTALVRTSPEGPDRSFPINRKVVELEDCYLDSWYIDFGEPT